MPSYQLGYTVEAEYFVLIGLYKLVDLVEHLSSLFGLVGDLSSLFDLVGDLSLPVVLIEDSSKYLNYLVLLRTLT